MKTEIILTVIITSAVWLTVIWFTLYCWGKSIRFLHKLVVDERERNASLRIINQNWYRMFNALKRQREHSGDEPDKSDPDWWRK